MKVGMYYGNADVRVEEQALPDIGAGDVLLRVVASGVCGSDLMEWYRIRKAPLVLGHEVTGEVVEVGADVEWLRLTPGAGVSPSEVAVTVVAGRLPPGTHVGTITVTMEGAPNSPASIPVQVTVPR